MSKRSKGPGGIDVEALTDEEARAESEALIEQFLAETGSAATREGTEGGVDDLRADTLPEGHRSGFVALIGRPNVGKSTLVNALVGEKIAIVSPKPQTTRTRIAGILTEPAHQVVFVDTPGIHKSPPFQLNKRMVDVAVAAIPDADLILFVADVSAQPREEDELIATLLQERAGKRPVFLVLNKTDQLTMEQTETRVEAYRALLPTHADSIMVSALRGTHLDQLRERILARLPEGPRYYPGDQITDQTEHQIASELIREALLRHTQQEVPHAAAVLIEDYHEREDGLFYVSARIWVERESQKPIIIGKGGQRLKQIGTEARAELERFIGGRVYLDLWVKVRPSWRDHAARLRELGY